MIEMYFKNNTLNFVILFIINVTELVKNVFRFVLLIKYSHKTLRKIISHFRPRITVTVFSAS